MVEQPEKVALRSMDIGEEKRVRLKAMFPAVFTETLDDKGDLVESIDFEKLKAELGTFSDLFEARRERYGLDWPGKKDCMRLIQQPSVATLKPCREESVNFDESENLFIEGDNLEVLKLLQKSYYSKVKMIYIDPPYNTGKEFIYPDKYSETLDTYLAYAGLADDEGRKFATNTPNEGRFHTKWLNMMYPRLYLARNLLQDDGYFVASIDDSELDNLRNILNEVFGEENFIATLVYDRNRKNDAKLFSVGHEYMVVYAKNKLLLTHLDIRLRAPKEGVDEIREEFKRLRQKHNDNWELVAAGLREYYSTFDEDDPRKPLTRYTKVDERGPFRSDGNPSWPGGGGPRYDVPHPTTGKPCKIPSRGWVWPTYDRMKEEIEKNNIVFGIDETTVPGVRMDLFEKDEQVMRSVTFSYAQKASQDFAKIFDGKKTFDNPKSYIDLKKLVQYLTVPGDLVLDFFAGTGTTGHSVIVSNEPLKANRKFICVQLPEPIGDNTEVANNALSFGCVTIADICKERIRRVIKKIEEERAIKQKESAGKLPGMAEEQHDLDLGFKVLKLDRSNFKVWDGSDPNATEEQIAKQLELFVEHINPKSSQEDILYELLLKSGFMPTEKVEKLTLAEKTVFSIAEGALLICLEDEITRDLIDAVAKAEPMRFICLDKGFKGNDQLKANAVQTFAARNQGREKAEQVVFRTV